MFGSEILEVAAGVVFVFILVSILCTAIREGIEAWLKTRASYLEYGIRELLHDVKGTGLSKDLFSHHLIFSLFLGHHEPPHPDKTKRRWRLPRGVSYPSYIPSRNFALALMDLAARGPAATPHSPEIEVLNLDTIRQNIGKLGNPQVQSALLTAIDSAQGDLNRATANIAAWYDSAMDRVSGWYKRTTQWIIFGIGLVVAVAMNINTIVIADFLYRNDAVRAGLVARAETAATDSAFLGRNYAEVTADLEEMNLPIGWSDSTIVPGFEKKSTVAVRNGNRVGHVSWFTAICGWFLTALAASLGAPFWFDMLNKIMVIRSTVKPHEKSPEEASEDRQIPGSPASQGGPGVPQPPPPSGGAAPADQVGQGGAPPPLPPPDGESEVDGCSCDFTADDDITSDEDLPPSEGGVA